MRSGTRAWWLQLGFALVLLVSASGGKIIWRSLARPHVTSDGLPLTGEMVFQLGVFSDEFVPTRSNVAQWASHWQVGAETAFDEEEGRFSETFAVTSNVAPFRLGTQGYVWGRQGAEWLLITGEDWRWPSDDPLAFSVTWSTLSADTVLAGELSSDMGEVHLRTERLDVGIAPQTWSEQQFGSGAPEDWLADPDEDGLSNQLEYALGTDPNSFDGEQPITCSDDGFVTVARAPNRAVTLVVEFSLDLESWTAVVPASWSLDSESPTRTTYVLGTGSEQVFMRMRAYW